MSKVPSILLKIDFYSKGRNIRWMKEHGCEAVLILQATWIASSQEKDCKILKEDAYSVPFLLTFPSEKVKKVLESAVEVGLLEGNETHYWNSQVAKDSKKFQAKHDNYSKASKKRERAKQEQDSDRILRESEQNHIDTDTEYITDIDLDLKFKELDTPEIRSEVRAFVAKVSRDSHGKNKVHQQTFDNWQSTYQGRPFDFLDALRFSNGLTKCVNLKERDKPQARGSPKKSTKDTLNELYQQAIAEEQNAKI